MFGLMGGCGDFCLTGGCCPGLFFCVALGLGLDLVREGKRRQLLSGGGELMMCCEKCVDGNCRDEIEGNWICRLKWFVVGWSG